MNQSISKKTLIKLIFATLIVCGFVLLQSCNDTNKVSKISGYIEADLNYVSSLQSGKIQNQYVKAGDEVNVDNLLFELNDELLSLQIQEANARVLQATSNLKNMQSGLRADEIDSLQAQLEEAKTLVNLKEKELDRTKNLLKQGLISKAIGDAALAEYESAQARVNTIQANIRVANLPARDEVIQSAKENLNALKAGLAQLNWKKEELKIKSEFSGLIFEVYYKQGEIINSAQPVLSMIKNNELHVTFFLEQNKMSQIELGDEVNVFIDGMDTSLLASVSYIASAAQFTPPVIYAKESRENMVYKIEAKLNTDKKIPLGLPVDISLKTL